MKKNVEFLIGLLLFFGGEMLAQNALRLKGTLIYENGKEVTEVYSITVVRKDTVMTQVNHNSYEKASFELLFQPKKEEDYFLYILVPGYQNIYVDVPHEDKNLGNLVVTPLSESLKEVVVQSQSIQRSFEEGKDVFKVAGTELSKEVSLTSLLNRFPGIYIDDGNVYILGAGKPIYTINGLLPRPGELEFITPDRIEKITIDRSPSALYASSVEGVIDIKLKSTVRDYLSAQASDDFSWGEWGTLSESPSVFANIQSGKWFAYIGNSYSYSNIVMPLKESFKSSLPNRSIAEWNDENRKFRKKSYRLATLLKYRFDAYRSLDFQYSFSFNESDTERHIETFRTDTELGDESILNMSFLNPLGRNHSLSSRYEYVKGNTRFALDAAYGYGKSGEAGCIYENFKETSSLVNRREDDLNRAYTFRAYLYRKFWNSWTLQAQASYAHAQASYDYRSLSDRTGEEIVTETNSRETIGIFSATLSYTWCKKWFLTLGLRGNYQKQLVDNRGDALKNEEEFFLVPTLNLAYMPSENLSMTLSYRKSEIVPDPSSLDPTAVYINRYMYQVGNPALKGVTSHNVKYAINLPYNLSFYTSFTYIHNGIQLVYVNDESSLGVVKQTYINLPRRALSTSLSWQCFGKNFYSLILNGKYAQEFGKMPYLEKRVSFSHPSFFIDAKHRFVLSKGLSTTLSTQYWTKDVSFPQETAKRYNVGVSLSYYVKNWSLSLSGSNLIASKSDLTTTYAYLWRRACFDMGRSVSFSVVYTFNKYTNKYKKNDANDSIFLRGQKSM